ncbi:MAG: hypothetical protein ACLSAP_09165 [Oscillospiraceae bacterium]
MTVMLVSVSERTREIGIKSPSAPNGMIMLEFMGSTCHIGDRQPCRKVIGS